MSFFGIAILPTGLVSAWCNPTWCVLFFWFWEGWAIPILQRREMLPRESFPAAHWGIWSPSGDWKSHLWCYAHSKDHLKRPSTDSRDLYCSLFKFSFGKSVLGCQHKSSRAEEFSTSTMSSRRGYTLGAMILWGPSSKRGTVHTSRQTSGRPSAAVYNGRFAAF